VLAQFGFLNVMVFLLKYAVALIRHPKRCAIIALPLQYTFHRVGGAAAGLASPGHVLGSGLTSDAEQVKPGAHVQLELPAVSSTTALWPGIASDGPSVTVAESQSLRRPDQDQESNAPLMFVDEHGQEYVYSSGQRNRFVGSVWEINQRAE